MWIPLFLFCKIYSIVCWCIILFGRRRITNELQRYGQLDTIVFKACTKTPVIDPDLRLILFVLLRTNFE